MSVTVSVLATGSEILDGRVLDTNSNYVARELAARGMRLVRVLCVDDVLEELLSGLNQLSAVSDVIITSGGLGPTSDDLTRDVVAKFAGVGLAEDPEARAHVEQFFARRGRAVDTANLKQALLPIGSKMIANHQGSAPGFFVTKGGCSVASLSGVPREFKAMFSETVLPFLMERATNLPRIDRRSFRTFGLPESRVGEVVAGLKLDSQLKVSYRAAFPEVHVGLVAENATEVLDAAVIRVKEALGSFIFSERGDTPLEVVLHELLLKNGLSIAVAESCTGGLLGEYLTSQPGSSSYFEGGVLAYQDRVKELELGVPGETLTLYGAVSPQTVEAMAVGTRAKFKCDIGVSISGVAGPGGGSDGKPVGTVYIGIASATQVLSRLLFSPNERSHVRRYAAATAMDMVRRHVLGLEIPERYPVARGGLELTRSTL